MSRTLTAADRSALIRLASTMPVGSKERKAILNGLKGASTKSATRFPEPMGSTSLVEWAAQEAAEVLTKNWKRALKDDPGFSTDVMAHDIDQVVESLNKWKSKIRGMRTAGLASDRSAMPRLGLRRYGPKDFRFQKAEEPHLYATARTLRDKLKGLQNLFLPIFPAGRGMNSIPYPGKDEALKGWFDRANDLFEAMADDSVSEREIEKLRSKLDDFERKVYRDHRKWSDDKREEYQGGGWTHIS